MQFSDGKVGRSALAELGQERELSVTIFRGRVGPEDASFELEVSGPAEKIKEFIRRSDTWGTSLGTSSVGIA
jgi:hypothetical protein